ncbi:unnamed protein product, partial [Timema podura]|nr:unnamed protein product [Timema podura]
MGQLLGIIRQAASMNFQAPSCPLGTPNASDSNHWSWGFITTPHQCGEAPGQFRFTGQVDKIKGSPGGIDSHTHRAFRQGLNDVAFMEISKLFCEEHVVVGQLPTPTTPTHTRMAIEWKKLLITLTIIALCFVGIPIHVSKEAVEEKEVLFQVYIKKHNKSYVLGSTEYHQRYDSFKESMALVEKLNNNRSSNLSAVYGITKFSDLTQDEFINHHLVPKLHHHVKLRLQSSLAHHNRIKTRALPDQLPLKVD